MDLFSRASGLVGIGVLLWLLMGSTSSNEGNFGVQTGSSQQEDRRIGTGILFESGGYGTDSAELRDFINSEDQVKAITDGGVTVIVMREKYASRLAEEFQMYDELAYLGDMIERGHWININRVMQINTKKSKSK